MDSGCDDITVEGTFADMRGLIPSHCPRKQLVSRVTLMAGSLSHIRTPPCPCAEVGGSYGGDTGTQGACSGTEPTPAGAEGRQTPSELRMLSSVGVGKAALSPLRSKCSVQRSYPIDFDSEMIERGKLTTGAQPGVPFRSIDSDRYTFLVV